MGMIKQLMDRLFKGSSFPTGSHDYPSYSDLFGVLKSPSPTELIKRFKEAAYSCATINAQAVAASTFRVYKTVKPSEKGVRSKGKSLTLTQKKWLGSQKALARKFSSSVDVVELESHPVIQLLEEGNELMDGYELLETTQLFLEMSGLGYWYLGEELGPPKEIYVLPTPEVEPLWNDSKSTMVGYKYRGKTYLPEQVIRFKFADLRDPYSSGMAPARAAYESLIVLEGENSYCLAIMNNQGRPDLMISPKEGLGAREASRLYERFRKKLRGKGQGDVIIGESALELKQLNWSPRDVGRLMERKFSKVMVYNTFGVPIALSEGESINRATLEAAIYQHSKLTILPRLTRLIQKMNQSLMPRYGDGVFLWFDNPVPEDEAAEAAMRKVDLETGYRFINELRAEEDLEPVEWGDRPMVPFGVGPMQEEVQDPNAPPPGEEDVTDPQDEEKPKPEDDEKQVTHRTLVLTAWAAGTVLRSKAKDELVLGGLSPEVAESWLNEVLRPFNEQELQESDHRHVEHASESKEDWHVVKSVGRNGHYRGMPKGRALSKALRGFFKKQERTLLSGSKSLGALLTSFKAMGDFPVDLSDWNDDLVKLARPFVEIGTEQGINDFEARNGVRTDLRLSSRHVQEAIDKATLSFAQSTNKTTSLEINEAMKRVRDTLSSGLITTGELPIQITRNIQKVFDKAEFSRADAIGLTESSRALHLGQVSAAKESGVVKGFEWLLSGDPCPKCLQIVANHPKGVSIGQDFGRSESKVEAYQRIEFPPAHPYCQCTVVEVVDEKAIESLENCNDLGYKKSGGKGVCKVAPIGGLSPEEEANYRYKHQSWMYQLDGTREYKLGKSAIKAWMWGEGADQVKCYDAGKERTSYGGKIDKVYKEQHKRMMFALKNAPRHVGVVFRGMSIPKGEVEKMFKVGNKMKIDSLTSFTKAKSVALSYSKPENHLEIQRVENQMTRNSHQRVVLEVKNGKSGIWIAPLDRDQGKDQEVLYQKGASLTFKSSRMEGGVLYVEAMEN